MGLWKRAIMAHAVLAAGLLGGSYTYQRIPASEVWDARKTLRNTLLYVEERRAELAAPPPGVALSEYRRCEDLMDASSAYLREQLETGAAGPQDYVEHWHLLENLSSLERNAQGTPSRCSDAFWGTR